MTVSSLLSLMLMLLLLTAGASLVAQGSSQGFETCAGCHGASERAPATRFPSGLGRWNDRQCVGCHNEINTISRTLADAGPTKLNFHLPLSLEAQARIATHPLGLEGTPALSAASLRDERFDSAGLAWFIRRPPGVRSSMPAFPSWAWNEQRKSDGVPVGTVGPAAPPPPPPRNLAARGSELFQRKGCAGCHGATGAAPHVFGFVRFTAAHLQYVATGQSTPPGRTMPRIPLKAQEAEAIRAWIVREKQTREIALDAQVARLAFRAGKPGASERRSVSSFASSLFGRFTREATCVHCHSTMPSAKARFDGTGEGLRSYVSRGGASELWRRLETRHLETEVGVTAARPGMPMNGSPLPRDFLTSLEAWILSECPDENGKALCIKSR